MNRRDLLKGIAGVAATCGFTWTASATGSPLKRWLSIPEWDTGRRDFTAADMHGRSCWAAIALASVSGFTAVCLGFPEGHGRVRFLWWFWLPEATAAKVCHTIPIDQWLADPRVKLTLTPGSHLDYGHIRANVLHLQRDYNIVELAYDQWNAEHITQEIAANGIPCVAFSQGIKAMSKPSTWFEAMVTSGHAEHNGDPLAKWMAQSATINPDCNGHYKPIVSSDPTKQIDGITAAVMVTGRLGAIRTGGRP